MSLPQGRPLQQLCGPAPAPGGCDGSSSASLWECSVGAEPHPKTDPAALCWRGAHTPPGHGRAPGPGSSPGSAPGPRPRRHLSCFLLLEKARASSISLG